MVEWSDSSFRQGVDGLSIHDGHLALQLLQVCGKNTVGVVVPTAMSARLPAFRVPICFFTWTSSWFKATCRAGRPKAGRQRRGTPATATRSHSDGTPRDALPHGHPRQQLLRNHLTGVQRTRTCRPQQCAPPVHRVRRSSVSLLSAPADRTHRSELRSMHLPHQPADAAAVHGMLIWILRWYGNNVVSSADNIPAIG